MREWFSQGDCRNVLCLQEETCGCAYMYDLYVCMHVYNCLCIYIYIYTHTRVCLLVRLVALVGFVAVVCLPSCMLAGLFVCAVFICGCIRSFFFFGVCVCVFLDAWVTVPFLWSCG